MKKWQFLVILGIAGCAPSGFKVGEDAGVSMFDAAVSTPDDAGESDAGRAMPDVDSGPEPDAGRFCFIDRDGDGVGAGNHVPCDLELEPEEHDDAGAPTDSGLGDGGVRDSADAGTSVAPQVVVLGNDCDDADARRAPTLSESCDGVDNDCDDAVDEQINNACGGPCVAPLEHEPGEACDNGLLGACLREGEYVCATAQSVSCDAPAQVSSTELCSDGIDNDCDGAKDEADAIDAVTWFQDCDGDGYAPSTAGSRKACTKPEAVGGCSWTSIVPQSATRTNWDCDDSRAAYAPGVDFGSPPAGANSWDLNCDGQAEATTTPGLRLCPQSVLDNLNNQGATDCDPSGISNNCITWKDAAGRFVRQPVSKCPDAAYKIVVRETPFSTWECSAESQGSLWKCR